MNSKQLINQIETKIEEIKTVLTHWTQKIKEHNTALTQLTEQLNQIKNKIK